MSKSSIRNIIFSLILISISGMSFGLMVYQINQQGEYLLEQMSALEKEQTQEASYLRLKHIAEDTKLEREELHSHFLSPEKDTIDFLNKIESMAPENGIELKTSGLNTITDAKDNTKWIQVDFSLIGSRERVQRFIQILETFPLVSRVKGLEMGTLSSTQWQADIIMQVQVSTYDQ